MKKDMNEHYYTERPHSDLKLGIIKTRLRGEGFRFLTSSGVFSKKDIDKGTRLLIENMVINDGDYVLDIGCGYGAIGIAAARNRRTRVVLTDINRRAVRLTEENIKLNDVGTNATSVQGDLYEAVEHEKFDVILCNLPMSAGLDLVFKIIDGSKRCLKKSGTVQVVVRKGNRTVEKRLQETFGNVKTLAKKGGYRVFISRNEHKNKKAGVAKPGLRRRP